MTAGQATETHRRRTLEEIEQRWGVVRLVRKELGITAFGAQVFELGPGMNGPGHDESRTGQEELYVGLAGAGWFEIGEDRVAFEAQTYLAVPPGVFRRPVAGPGGLTYLCIGGVPGRAYAAIQKFS